MSSFTSATGFRGGHPNKDDGVPGETGKNTATSWVEWATGGFYSSAEQAAARNTVAHEHRHAAAAGKSWYRWFMDFFIDEGGAEDALEHFTAQLDHGHAAANSFANATASIRDADPATITACAASAPRALRRRAGAFNALVACEMPRI